MARAVRTIDITHERHYAFTRGFPTKGTLPQAYDDADLNRAVQANLALRKGARVANLPLAPAMAFIDTSDTIIGAEIARINARYIKAGQDVEVTFKVLPGRIFSGKVETILQAIATGQAQVSGQAVAPGTVQSAPFVIRIKLDDQQFAHALPAGATGTAAIFTDHVKPTHIIRKVLLRQVAILNYLNPF
jgi:multidrug resistance efflux pump